MNLSQTLLLTISCLGLVACAPSLDGKKIRSGDIVGAQGLEKTEIQELLDEVQAQAPQFKLPKDGDNLTTRIRYSAEKLKEFDSSTIAGHKCRYSFIEEENSDTISVVIEGENTTYKRERKKTPLNPQYLAVPRIATQEEACNAEIEKLTDTKIESIDFSQDRSVFNKFFSDTFLKTLENCEGVRRPDSIRCAQANIERSEVNDSPLPTYSMNIRFGLIQENGDFSQSDFFMEVSPKMTHFFPYGVFNLQGKLYADMITEFQGIESVTFWSINF